MLRLLSALVCAEQSKTKGLNVVPDVVAGDLDVTVHCDDVVGEGLHSFHLDFYLRVIHISEAIAGGSSRAGDECLASPSFTNILATIGDTASPLHSPFCL